MLLLLPPPPSDLPEASELAEYFQSGGRVQSGVQPQVPLTAQAVYTLQATGVASESMVPQALSHLTTALSFLVQMALPKIMASEKDTSNITMTYMNTLFQLFTSYG